MNAQEQDIKDILGYSVKGARAFLKLITIPFKNKGDINELLKNTMSVLKDKEGTRYSPSLEKVALLKIDDNLNFKNEDVENDFKKIALKYNLEYNILSDNEGNSFFSYMRKDAEKMNKALTEWSKSSLFKNSKEFAEENKSLNHRVSKAQEKLKDLELKEQNKARRHDIER